MPWPVNSTVENQSLTDRYDPNSGASPATNMSSQKAAIGARAFGAGFLPVAYEPAVQPLASTAGADTPHTVNYNNTALMATAPQTTLLGPGSSATRSRINRLTTAASPLTHVIPQANTAWPAAAIVNLARSMQGDPNRLSGPRAYAGSE